MAIISDDERNYVMVFGHNELEVYQIEKETPKSFVTDIYWNRRFLKTRPHKVFARKRDAEKFKKHIKIAYDSTVISKTESLKAEIKSLNTKLANIKRDLRQDIFDNLEINYTEFLI